MGRTTTSRRARPAVRRGVLAIVLSAALLVVTGAVSAPAQASTSSSGCTVHAYYPNYYNGKMQYHGWVSCGTSTPAYGLDIWIGNEWFKPGHSTASWSGSAFHDCGGGGNKTYCGVSSTGSYLGAGEYCTVAEADLYFDTRITTRMCTTFG